jgi:hypothetical protein
MGARQLLRSLLAPAPSGWALVVYLLVCLLLSAGLLVLLHRTLDSRGRRRLTVVVTFLAGLFFTLEYFYPVHAVRGKPSPENFLTPWVQPANELLAVIMAFTVGLGIYSLVQIHGRNLLRLRSGWGNSLAFFISMVLMFTFALWDNAIKLPEPPPTVLPYPKAVFEVLFNGLFMPLQSATFSLLAFYIASAAYRAFRVRSMEAGLMMVTAFLVMLGQVPIGAWLTQRIPTTGSVAFLGFFRMERLGEWIMTWLNSPAQRGITFGVAIGALAMSLRIWLSLERGTFFSEQSDGGADTAPTGGEA